MANKIVDADMLDNGLTAIADSIRAKTGEQDALAFPDGFVDAVDSIEQGGEMTPTQALQFWARNVGNAGTLMGAEITEIPDLEFPICTSAQSMLYGNANVTKIGNLHFPLMSSATGAQQVFRNVSNLTTIGDVTFDKAPNLYYCYAGNGKLTEAGKVIVPNATKINYLFMNAAVMKRCGGIVGSSWTNSQSAFYGCKELEEIVEPLDFSSCTTAGEMFRLCTKLKEVRFVAESIRVNIGYLGDCKELSPASVQSVIDGLADLTDETTQTLNLHSSISVSDEQKAAITLKNWTLVQ